MPRHTTSTKRRDSDSGGSEYSAGSGKSASTAPTDYSVRPGLRHWDTDISDYLAECKEHRSDSCASSASSTLDDNESILTYASTVPSEADFEEGDPEYPVYGDEPDEQDWYEPTAFPATPTEFAEYFPSTRRLCIRHDDTIDGNMNLRVDTDVPTTDGGHVDLTLFHLRMHDLKNREFSLRRYCRNSGREVCHSSRKYTKPASDRRPALSRSMGSALAAPFRPKSSDSKLRAEAALKRTDSGYDSMSDDEDHADGPGKQTTSTNIPVPTNTTNIEFSNYAHVELKRRGTKGSKRYEYAYWGRSYTWRRVVQKKNGNREISYHLYDSQLPKAVAHIVPVPMTPNETEEGEGKGGWIPPSSMWISDPHCFGRLADIADVVVATGLMALVDNCIKQRWHRKDRFHFPVPIPNLSSKGLNMEYIGPKRLIDEVFNRRGSNSTRRSPLRQITA